MHDAGDDGHAEQQKASGVPHKASVQVLDMTAIEVPARVPLQESAVPQGAAGIAANAAIRVRA